MMVEEIELRVDKKRMKGEDHSSTLHTDARTHTCITYLYIISLFPSHHLLRRHHRKHLMVVSCCENEKSVTEFPPLSQIPASLASRRRRRRCRRWNVKSGSTTTVVTNDRGRAVSSPLQTVTAS